MTRVTLRIRYHQIGPRDYYATVHGPAARLLHTTPMTISVDHARGYAREWVRRLERIANNKRVR